MQSKIKNAILALLAVAAAPVSAHDIDTDDRLVAVERGVSEGEAGAQQLCALLLISPEGEIRLSGVLCDPNASAWITIEGKITFQRPRPIPPSPSKAMCEYYATPLLNMETGEGKAVKKSVPCGTVVYDVARLRPVTLPGGQIVHPYCAAIVLETHTEMLAD